MNNFYGQSRLDLMEASNQAREANIETRKTYTGGNPVPSFKQQEYSNSAYELELSQQRMDLLKGGSKKKTKQKKQNKKQHERHVKVRVRTKKRRNTRKKNNYQHYR